MSNNPGQIVVGSGGAIYIAQIGSGAPLPAGVNQPLTGAGYSEMGFISEEGISASFGVEVADIAAFQSLLPVRRVVTARNTEVSFTLRQWNVATFAVALGGGTYDLTSTGDYSFTPPANDAPLQELIAVIEWSDGSRKYRLVIPRAVVVEDVETTIVRDAAADLPVTLSVLGNDQGDSWYLVTNDEAFDLGIPPGS